MKAFTDIIKQLVVTRSPSEQKAIILEASVFDRTLFCEDELKELTVLLNGEIAKKKQQGNTAVENRKHSSKSKKNNKTTYKKPVFYSDYKVAANCACCGDKISSSNAFRWMKLGQYEDYHATPECWISDREAFAYAPTYLKYIAEKERGIK